MKINENIYDIALHTLGRTKSNPYVVIIGAMDGVSFDETRGYIAMYDWSGLFVEPIDVQFKKLVNVYKDKPTCKFENSAISEKDGKVVMLTINNDAINNGAIHECFGGMSAIYPPKNGLASEGDRQTVEKYGELKEVNCITLSTLFKRHDIQSFDIISIDTEGHDYIILKQIDFSKYTPKVIRIEYINLNETEQEEAINILTANGYVYNVIGQNLDAVHKSYWEQIAPSATVAVPDVSSSVHTPKVPIPTLVTGLWNLGRDRLKEGWSRSFDHYLLKFDELLKVEHNLIIFGDKELQDYVFSKRKLNNTQFVLRSLDWFKENEYYEIIQNIRVKEEWLNQSGWLRDSTQATLEMYNPIVMSKVFLLNDAKILDKFNSTHLYWVDAGITNTVHSGYFTHDNVIEKITNFTKKLLFVCFPYDGTVEVHGFEYNSLCAEANAKTDMVARAGFFGGAVDCITEFNSLYYAHLLTTLRKGLMGTEESIFTILTYKYPHIFDHAKINNDGLLSTFFENVKNNNVVLENCKSVSHIAEVIGTVSQNSSVDISSVRAGVYVITYNSPKQFKTLIDSMLAYDSDFLNKTTKYLLDNSSDESTFTEYAEICKEYNFEHIKKDNLGICGGRQFIAEHFNKTDLDYMYFFEDDMFFYPKKGETCKCGFNRFTDNLFTKTLQIMEKEKFDFLKLSFSEFYGDNSTQWTWYNVPQVKREEYWPHYSKLPELGTDPNSPKTDFKNIKIHDRLPYITGDVYYCNWPQLVSKNGSKKMFLDTTWAHPFEQTWMSHIFQETKKGNITPGLLLLSPTEHNRFDHYDGSLRKES